MISGSGVQALEQGQYGHYSENVLNLRKSSSLPPFIIEKNYMHDYDVHEAVYLNCKFDDLWVRGSGPRAGPIWPYRENA